MQITGTVTVDLSRLHRFQQYLAQGTHPAIQAIYKQWGARYRGFAQRRFSTYSKGGGNWPALTESTIRARRSGKARRTQAGKKVVKRTQLARRAVRKGGKVVGHRLVQATKKVDILRDTGMLMAALNPIFAGQPGGIQTLLPNGVEVGFGGPGRHASGGTATISDIADFHNVGAGHNPRRDIIVDPPTSVLNAMSDDARRGVQRFLDDTMR